jgi:hypothetical protein
VKILTNLVNEITTNHFSVSDVLRIQQGYHEKRRWSVYNLINDRKIGVLEERDKAALWHAARAELTTQPAGIRLAVDGVKLAQELADNNPLGSKIAHIAAAWSARYWLEEEAHHEVAYGLLLEMAGIEPIENDEVVQHRGFFPSDNYARVCILQACVEIEASITYGEMARTSTNPLVKDVFLHIMRDEVQHRQYFLSFAKALIDANVYPVKDILSMAYTWLRPGAGETHGSTRTQQARRTGFVNWWEHVKTDEKDDLHLRDDQIRSNKLLFAKTKSVLSAVKNVTGIHLGSIKALEHAYYESLKTKNIERLRSTINSGV